MFSSFSQVRRGALVFALIVCFSVPLLCADDPPAKRIFSGVPFDDWVAQGPVQTVPWKVELESPGLSVHQRSVISIAVTVRGKELVKRHADERLVLYLRVKDASGRRFHNFDIIDVGDVLPGETRRQDYHLLWAAFALPGNYQVFVALHDKASGEHNLFEGKLSVPALKNDPLPDAWSNLPAVEFWAPIKHGPDYQFHSDVKGRLNLPLATKSPVQLDVWLDLTASDIFAHRTNRYNHYTAGAVPTFKALTQIALANGKLSAETLDIVQERTTFEQEGVTTLDWPHLKQALSPENGPGVIAARSLHKRWDESPAFLRTELQRRVSEIAEKYGPELPLHVFIIVGSPLDFYKFPHFQPIELPAGQKCVVYYVQFISPELAWATGNMGKLEKMLRPLPVRTFRVHSPEEARSAIAAILGEISRL